MGGGSDSRSIGGLDGGSHVVSHQHMLMPYSRFRQFDWCLYYITRIRWLEWRIFRYSFRENSGIRFCEDGSRIRTSDQRFSRHSLGNCFVFFVVGGLIEGRLRVTDFFPRRRCDRMSRGAHVMSNTVGLDELGEQISLTKSKTSPPPTGRFRM